MHLSKSEQFMCSSAIDICNHMRNSFSGLASDFVDLPGDVRQIHCIRRSQFKLQAQTGKR